MKNDFTKINLFSCPIYKIRIDPNSYDKEKILNDILYNKNLKTTRNETHQSLSRPSHTPHDIHHSHRDFNNENFRSINYEKLIPIYSEIFDDFFNKEIKTIKDFQFKFKIVNYVAMTEGQHLPSHFHTPCDFSTIHYLNFKDGHELTSFENPADFAPYVRYLQPELVNILARDDLDNSYAFTNYEIPAEEDDFIIFPSIVSHHIFPQEPTKESRITVSTNIKIADEDGEARMETEY